MKKTEGRKPLARPPQERNRKEWRPLLSRLERFVLGTGVRGGQSQELGWHNIMVCANGHSTITLHKQGASNQAASLVLIPLPHKKGAVSLRKTNERYGQNDGIPFYSSCRGDPTLTAGSLLSLPMMTPLQLTHPTEGPGKHTQGRGTSDKDQE